MPEDPQPMSQEPGTADWEAARRAERTDVPDPLTFMPVADRPADSRRAKPPESSFTTSVFLRRSWIVVLGAIVVAAITYGVSSALTPTYTSTSDVAVLVSGSDPEDVSLGANTLASQFAQEATATNVLAAADKKLGSSGPVSRSSVSSGAVSAQNVIEIQVSASSAAVAQQRTAAVTDAFVNYLTQQTSAQESTYRSASAKEVAPLTRQISSLERQLRNPKLDSAAQQQLESALSAVISSRANALSNIAQTVSVDRPAFTLVTAATGGSKTSPKPALYALVGLIIGFLVFARLVTLVGLGRYRRA